MKNDKTQAVSIMAFLGALLILFLEIGEGFTATSITIPFVSPLWSLIATFSLASLFAFIKDLLLIVILATGLWGMAE